MSLISTSQEKPLSDTQRRELLKLRDRLLNLSSRNRSIRLNRLDAKWTFDLSLLNPFGMHCGNEVLEHCLKNNTPKDILPKPKDKQSEELYQKLSLQLTHLHRSIMELQREKGLHDLYIGFPFLRGIPVETETVIQAPVFLLPVILEKNRTKKTAASWTISSSKDLPVLFNKTLFLALSKMCNLSVNSNLFEEEIPSELYGATSFIQQTHQLLNEYGIRCDMAAEAQDKALDSVLEFSTKDLPSSFQIGKMEICQHAVLGHFSQSNSSLQRDYDEFLEWDQKELDSLTCFLSPELEGEQIPLGVSELPKLNIDERKESENFFLLSSDSSQDRILLELTHPQSSGMVVWGPPGTGKSQTIVNIIGDCLARGKSVLLVSQKRAALDVVYDRLGAKGLTSLVGLVHDSKTDRKDLYAKINQVIPPSEKAELLDPSAELERIGNILKEVARAYNDDQFGIKLGELYRLLGGNKKGASLSLDLEFWKKASHEELQKLIVLLNSFQKHIRIESSSSYFKARKSLSSFSSQEWNEIKNKLDALTQEETLFKKQEGFTKYFKPSYWKNRAQIQKHALLARSLLSALLHKDLVNSICESIFILKQDKKALQEFAETLNENFNELKSYDLELESLPLPAQKIAKSFELALENKQVAPEEEWGAVLRRSVYQLWIEELEKQHPVIARIRSGQIDSLRIQYKEALQNKMEYCSSQLQQKSSSILNTSEGQNFKREISADVSKTRNIFSIRKLNEKYFKRAEYRTLLPVWLASPETVSDIFPLTKDLFDVVIFDEASQCTVEQGLPAIYRGKQVIIAGDEKQLPPTKIFESTFDEEETEEDSHATEEPSLLTLAKKTLRYTPHLLEWHYRSKHQELITFSNEVFYQGRMKIAPNVMPFQKGNKSVIEWHAVPGYWKERSNREEALKIMERLRFFLSLPQPPTLGVITFNASQKELILDLIEETQEKDAEFRALLYRDRQRPIDAQLFVKNIENVQGDEREIILFSVAYAPSEPEGRVQQLFGSLNAKGGENRLNVAVTRAIQGIEIISSIHPERDLQVSNSVNAGPKILKNYLRFAHAVAQEDFERVKSLLQEINPNLSASNKTISQTVFEAEVFQELKQMGFEVHTQVGHSEFRIDMALVHPQQPNRYLLGIECDGAVFHENISTREREVFRQKFLEDRAWKIHRIWSCNWWENKTKELDRIKKIIEANLNL